jgi:hypothetical protein
MSSRVTMTSKASMPPSGSSARAAQRVVAEVTNASRMPAPRAHAIASTAPATGSGSRRCGSSATISASSAAGSSPLHGPSTVRKTSSARRPVNCAATESS